MTPILATKKRRKTEGILRLGLFYGSPSNKMVEVIKPNARLIFQVWQTELKKFIERKRRDKCAKLCATKQNLGIDFVCFVCLFVLANFWFAVLPQNFINSIVHFSTKISQISASIILKYIFINQRYRWMHVE